MQLIAETLSYLRSQIFAHPPHIVLINPQLLLSASVYLDLMLHLHKVGRGKLADSAVLVFKELFDILGNTLIAGS